MAKKFRDLAAAIDNDPVRRAKVDEEKRAMYTILALAALRNARGDSMFHRRISRGSSTRRISISLPCAIMSMRLAGGWNCAPSSRMAR